MRGEDVTLVLEEAGLVRGRFALREVIGEGAGSVVYRGVDSAAAEAAVKVPRPGGLDVGQLVREAEALPLVSSRHVPRLLAASTVAEPFVATDLVPGVSLARRLGDGPLPWREAQRVGLWLWDAVRDVHAAGLVHRDVKPGNVLVSPDALYLVDFGLASSPGNPPDVGAGLLVGTPGFLPPEALRSEDSLSVDWWAWAATLVHLVSGHPAFPGSPVEANERALRSDPDLSGVPDSLREVLQKAFSQHPADRPSPNSLRSALEGAVPASTSAPTEQIPVVAHTMVFSAARSNVSARWVVVPALAGLVTFGAVAPFQAAFTLVLLVSSVLAYQRLGDASWGRTLLRFPGVALRSVLGGFFRALGPLLLGAASAWLLAFLDLSSDFLPGFALALLVGAGCAVLGTWWGLGGASVRSGTLRVVDVAAPTRRSRQVVSVVLVVFAVLAWGVVLGRDGSPDWSLLVPGLGVVN